MHVMICMEFTFKYSEYVIKLTVPNWIIVADVPNRHYNTARDLLPSSQYESKSAKGAAEYLTLAEVIR